MFKHHNNFFPPKDHNAKIWRYLDFTKYVSLLEKQALFFTRADKFDDLFEGVSPKTEVEYFLERSKDRPGRDEKKDRKVFLESEQKTRRDVAINCWHLSEHESVAMWKIYLKSEEGLAIQSSYNRLKDSLHAHIEDDVHIGIVNYIDYDKENLKNKLYFNFTHKRQFFEYEKELRAFIRRFHRDIENPKRELAFSEYLTLDGFLSGDYIKVDLNILVEKIVIAPTAPSWFAELVTSISAKYGLRKPVESSVISNKPYS